MAGSLYLLLAADIEEVIHGPMDDTKNGQCNCQRQPQDGVDTLQQQTPSSRGSTGALSSQDERQLDFGMRHASQLSKYTSPQEKDVLDEAQRRPTGDNGDGTKRPKPEVLLEETLTTDKQREESGSRHRVAEALIALGGALGTATQDSFDMTKFREGAALEFPEVPGEGGRNPYLDRFRETYNPAAQASRSRASSFNEPRPPRHGLESFFPSRDPSPRIARSSSSTPSTRMRASTLPAGPSQAELQAPDVPSIEVDPDRGRPRQRHNTLEVPVPAHLRPFLESPPLAHLRSVTSHPSTFSSPRAFDNSSVFSSTSVSDGSLPPSPKLPH